MERCGAGAGGTACAPRRTGAAHAGVLLWLLASVLFAGRGFADWPTYQRDNGRSGITGEALKLPLYGQWVFVSRAPRPAWPEPVKELPRVRFDDAYHVVASEDAVYFGSSADDKVYCLDAATGEIRWSTFTGGPVRLAPTLWKDRVLVGSDDGNAYCLAANDGTVLWKARAAFDERKVLGNGRMISLWPVRTGVVVDDGIAYFGAGIFPSEGIFLCAVRADDGTLVWRNDTCGERGPEQEFGGISPQGYLLASESKLYVPSGRAMPAAFDRNDGRFLYHCSPGGKVGGTWALLTEEHLVAGLDDKVSYDRETGARIGNDRYAWFPGLNLVAAPDCSYLLTHTELLAIDRKAYPAAIAERRSLVERRDKLSSRIEDLRKKLSAAQGDARAEISRQISESAAEIKALEEKRTRLEDSLIKWRRSCENASSMILAGGVLFVGGDENVLAVEAATGKELWSGKVAGKSCGLAVSGGRLFVSTDNGAIHCFAEAESAGARAVKQPVVAQPYSEDELTAVYASAADSIVRAAGVKKGYCLVLGCGEGRLAFELARRTELKIVGIEPDSQKVEVARRKLDAAGLYGSRVAIEQGSSSLPFSDYFANLVVSEDILVLGKPQGSFAEVFRVLRPYGGVAIFGQPANATGIVRPLGPADLRNWLSGAGEPEVERIQDGGAWTKITRGALEGAGSWTHLYADAANTACSEDCLVKCPLGVLWFGDPGPQKMVERHARAAGPLSINGRLFVQGENVVMAYDAYNGVLLWERNIPGAVRVRVDADGSNLAVSEHGLFVAVGSACFRLDPGTGETLSTYKAPSAGDGAPRRWGYQACVGNLLFGSTAEPIGEYGALWQAIVQPDGTWRPPSSDAPPYMRTFYSEVVSRYPRPNERAFADLEEMGAMWETMARFPLWGEIRTPQGALTLRMMTSDSLFAVDIDTGELRWSHKGKKIAHPTISVADGTVFFAESSLTSEQKETALAEKRAELAKLSGEEAAEAKRTLENADVRLVVALDAATGEKRWEKVHDLTGCGGDRMGSACRDGTLLFFGFFSNHDRGLFRSGTLKWRRVTALSARGGEVLWSREIGYLRRPVVMGDKLIVEPWMCDIRTGELVNRVHPVTGKVAPWEFIRGGHSCGITTASPNCFFLRSYSTTYYDLTDDSGMLPFGGIRGGCWVNIIMANGLVLYPEASSGCRCSFPIVSSVALAPKQRSDQNRPWSLFPAKGEQTPGDGALTPVKRLAINFGAPGDRKDEAGVLWFGYPRPKLRNLQVDWVMKLSLNETILPDMGYFERNFRGVQIEGTDTPWVFASGCVGMSSCEAPLIEKTEEAATYTVRMYFAAPLGDEPGKRVFDIKLQKETVLKDFDIVRSAGATQRGIVKEFKGVAVAGKLAIEFVPKTQLPRREQAPLINGIEIIREET